MSYNWFTEPTITLQARKTAVSMKSEVYMNYHNGKIIKRKNVGNVDRMILIRLRMSVSVCEYIYMDREKTGEAQMQRAQESCWEGARDYRRLTFLPGIIPLLTNNEYLLLTSFFCI